LLDIPPTGLSASLLIYPPTRAQWGARAGGLWGGFLNPAKLICMGLAKNGLTCSQPHTVVPRTPKGVRRPRRPRAGPWKPAGTFCTVSGCPGCPRRSGCSLLIYPPTRAQCLPRAGGLWGGFLNPAKLICMGLAKNGLTCSQPRRYVTRAATKATRQRHLPNGLPCTSRLPSGLPCTSQPTYPAPRPPTNPPTLHPPPTERPTLHRSHHTPSRLPCTTVSPTKQPTLHLSPTYRAAYPAPTKSPTLHLPLTK
jgi:hypothetical protein